MTKHVLLIDDEPNLNEILGQYLHRLGYTSDATTSGDLAVDLLKKNDYWAVFCDLKMPGINGLDLFDKIQCLSEKALRFVLLTGAILDSAIEDKVSKQHIVVCRKPFNFENIKQTLRSLESRQDIQGQTNCRSNC